MLAAVASQKEMKSAYVSPNQPVGEPSTYCFDTKSWIPRDHWAKDLPLWALLTEAEEHQAAKEADFTTNEVPLHAAHTYWASTQSKGAMHDPDRGLVGLESVEALRHAPLMRGMNPGQIRKAGPQKKFARLVARKKTESGKWHHKKTRHFWVASFPAKAKLRRYNDWSRTVVRLHPHCSLGSSGKQKLQSKKAICSWLKRSPLRFVESSDRVAWPESQIHEAVGVVHRMIEGTVGREVGRWKSLFSSLEIGAAQQKRFLFGTKKERK